MTSKNVNIASREPFEIHLQGCVSTLCSPPAALKRFIGLTLDDQNLDSCNEGQRNNVWIIGFQLAFQHFLLSKHNLLWNQLESSSTVQLCGIQPSSFPLSPECICI